MTKQERVCMTGQGTQARLYFFQQGCFPDRVLMSSPPKQKDLNTLHKAFAQVQLEEAYKKISLS